jgi:hypothetical protein
LAYNSFTVNIKQTFHFLSIKDYKKSFKQFQYASQCEPKNFEIWLGLLKAITKDFTCYVFNEEQFASNQHWMTFIDCSHKLYNTTPREELNHIKQSIKFDLNKCNLFHLNSFLSFISLEKNRKVIEALNYLYDFKIDFNNSNFWILVLKSTKINTKDLSIFEKIRPIVVIILLLLWLIFDVISD